MGRVKSVRASLHSHRTHNGNASQGLGTGKDKRRGTEGSALSQGFNHVRDASFVNFCGWTR